MSKMSLSVERAGKAYREPGYGPSVAVERLAQADRAIAEAITATDAVRLVATATALAEWARAVKAGEDHERQAAVFVLRAKRNAGERLAEAQAKGEVARPGGIAGSGTNVAHDDIATLAEIGVTRDQSSEWKQLARDYSDEDLAAVAEDLPRPSIAALRNAALTDSDRAEEEEARRATAWARVVLRLNEIVTYEPSIYVPPLDARSRMLLGSTVAAVRSWLDAIEAEAVRTARPHSVSA